LKEKTIVAYTGNTPPPVSEPVIDADSLTIEIEDDEEEFNMAENSDDYEEVIRRQDDIDQYTHEFICRLIGVEPDDISLEDIGIDTKTLEAIEDQIEDILHEHGITIYRPTMIPISDGTEIMVPSIFDTYN